MRTLFLTLITCLFVLPAHAKYSGGTGDPNDPYQIATAADLIALGETPDDYGKRFILTADIDLDPNLPGRKVFDRAVIAPDMDLNEVTMEYQGTPFTGVFDGQGHTISHLTIRGGSYLGLFGQLGSGDSPAGGIRNLGLVDVNIIGTGTSVGGLVGFNFGVVGGNYSSGSIDSSYSSGSVCGGYLHTGGIVGTNGGELTGCYSSGSVSGKTNIGGLAGNNYGTVTRCYSTSMVTGTKGVGGFVGLNNGGTVTQCYGGGSISGDGYVGGLVGSNITSGHRGIVAQCYSTGMIGGTSEVGGLVGFNQAIVTQCYSTGAVSGTGADRPVGGLVGLNLILKPSGTVIQCFWDVNASGQTVSDGGTGKTTAEMQTAKTFQGWGTCGDEGVWTIDEGNDYPRLAWENWPGEAIRSAMLSDLLLGSGTQDDPFLIFTPEELNVIGLYPCEWDKHFKVMADIDLSGFDGTDGRPAFNQIAPGRLSGGWDFRGTPFTGVLDGNGHEIQHLTLTIMDGGCGGLIGGLSGGGEVKDLGVVDANITSSGGGVGGLVGVVEWDWPEGKGAVTRCYTTGTVQGDYYVGGMVGINRGDLAQCHSTAVVSGSGGDIGGLVGSNGGVVAECYSTGTVGGHYYVGGLVGSNGKSMEDGWSGEVTNCYSTAEVTGTGEWGGVGGLVGGNDRSSIVRCYSTGTVAGNKDVGGLVGNNEFFSDVIDSFWDVQRSGQSTSAGGTGKTTVEMQNIQTYQEAGWDFVGEMQDGLHEIWQMEEGGGYPVLAILSGYIPPQLEGHGTPDSPYLISDAFDLGAMIRYSPSACYRLAASIDLSGIRWGTAVIPSFSGAFDGNNLTISHLTIKGWRCLGLFGQLGGWDTPAEVKNLGVVDVNIVGSEDYIGGLVGYSYSIVDQCYSTGAVSGKGFNVGGLTGWNDGTIDSSYSSSAVSGTGRVGGLVGSNSGSVANSYSSGSVSGTNDVGGLAGVNRFGLINYSYSTASVSGTNYVGGFAGHSYQGNISLSFWDVQTSGQTMSAGGIGKTTAEMQTTSTFLEAGWDFVGETENGTEDIWWILEGKDYPRLWWEAK